MVVDGEPRVVGGGGERFGVRGRGEAREGLRFLEAEVHQRSVSGSMGIANECMSADAVFNVDGVHLLAVAMRKREIGFPTCLWPRAWAPPERNEATARQ